ncbi:MAG: ABC transporter ATP-binding protein [Deferrisomatales bacterium]|nr:ABC transporter ATP-binding protein [Deferrisomatales bacterium]
MADPLLQLEEVRAGYGEAVVLDGISLAIGQGESLAILGRNGVGKSTLVLTIMNLTALFSGTVRFRGRDVTRTPAHRRARLGFGWVPQERDIFPSLSVEENLTVVARPGPWDRERVFGLFPSLKERRENAGNQLSGGEQQMLAIGRTLMSNPQLLLLDEPMEGLAPIVVDELAAAIAGMTRSGDMALVLVEQHGAIALELTDRAIVIERGRIAHAAPSAVMAGQAAPLDRYLGLNLADK